MQREARRDKALPTSSSPPPPQSLPRPSTAKSANPDHRPSVPKDSQPDAKPAPPTKALRFVTNYGAPQPKRRRIGAACLNCRRRKTACSGERPACETCTQNKLKCAGYADGPLQAPRRTSPDEDVSRASDTSHLITTEGKPESFTAPSQNTLRPQTDAKSPMRTTAPHPTARSTHSSPPPKSHRKPPSPESPEDNASVTRSLFDGPRNRMPYFRWLGPTAIMPGFKQMMVKVKQSDAEQARSSSGEFGITSPVLSHAHNTDAKVSSIGSSASAAVDSEVRTPIELPTYDASPLPPSELMMHLTETFFSLLGCNFPFLQHRTFLRDLEDKKVDAILVDAVCALAARFSTHPMLTRQAIDTTKPAPSDYGHAFAQRAKVALVDAFHCPSIAHAQAALLLAYNEFGEQKDSGLWMYLGIAIRFAQDLGMHKLEGLRYVGHDGPTPRTAKLEAERHQFVQPHASAPSQPSLSRRRDYSEDPDMSEEDAVEQAAAEQERVDTFWAIFFLDRVVSSGTGRRSTLRDKDIELSFPPLSTPHGDSDWPSPFPSLIRIIHLYGRVADLLNSFKEPSDLTTDTLKRLAAMESQVINFYQGLSERLHFDAPNFHHYMKAGEGTNFVLLHFWFHTLIVQLHQPTLLKTFGGRMTQLFPNSQQLSMSSAKTIADILSYSHLMDGKASLGNPFTTQPIYIAACAFLKEIVEQTATNTARHNAGSAEASHPTENWAPGHPNDPAHRVDALPTTQRTTPQHSKSSSSSTPRTQPVKHSLLATAASQHYQLCYKALQSLETYWAGTTYILTVLDQKFEGVRDPLLYTAEEGESALERPRPEPAFTSPGWRRKLSWPQELATMPAPFWNTSGFAGVSGSPMADPSKAGNAIGYTLTGTMNSPSTQVARHYTNGNENSSAISDSRPYSDFGHNNLPSYQPLFAPQLHSRSTAELQSAAGLAEIAKPSLAAARYGTPHNDANTLLVPAHSYGPTNTMHSPVSAHMASGNSSYFHNVLNPIPAPSLGPRLTSGPGMVQPLAPQLYHPTVPDLHNHHHNHYAINLPMPSDEVLIESEAVDMHSLGLDNMLWLNFYPEGMPTLFDENASTTDGAVLPVSPPTTTATGARLGNGNSGTGSTRARR